MNRIYLLLFVCVPLITGGCDFYPQDDYEEYYVVESYLVANRTLPQVRVSHTLPVEEEYTPEKAAVSDAIVEIRLLDENDTVEEVYSYSHHSNGVYLPVNTAIVRPLHRYELQVTFSHNNDEITAQTLVPGAFETIGSVKDSVTYQSDQQVEVTTTRSEYPGRQSYFIFTVNAINPSRDKLTPFYRNQISEDDDDMSSLHTNSSGIINEENYTVHGDGTLTLRLPWLAVAFYEDNYITANAIDDNMYDFIRTQNGQSSGGSTLPLGEIQNIRYNVEGGIGIFGSMATDTAKVYIARQ